MRWRLSVYRMLMGVGVREATVHRGNYLFNLLGALVQVFMLSMVWRAVYQDRASVDGVDLSTMISYVTLISVQTWLLNTAAVTRVPERVRQGQVAFDICRPIGLLEQVFARQFGWAIAIVPFALVALPFATWIGEMRAPASVGSGGLYVVSLIAAYLIATLSTTTIGLLAFWAFEIRGMLFVYRTIQTFCAGALVPLWFMPDWLRMICEVLPFQAMAYTPVSIYLGRLDGGEAFRALGIQLFWIAAIAGLAFLTWRRALHKVVIQGG